MNHDHAAKFTNHDGTLKNAREYYAMLAKNHNLPLVDLNSVVTDTTLLHLDDMPTYLKFRAIPINQTDTYLTLATADPSEQNRKKIAAHWRHSANKEIKIVVATLQDITTQLAAAFQGQFTSEISLELYNLDPNLSSRFPFSSYGERFVIFAILLIQIATFIFMPFATIFYINAYLAFGTLVILFYKTYLSIIVNITKPLPNTIPKVYTNEEDYPTYTILIPLFKEGKDIISLLLNSLQHIDYPPDKLDVKLLLESDDKQTIDVINTFKLPFYFQILFIPPGTPRSKPRACNYGLKFAVGEYLTIYDAEDIPDPQQLKKVLRLFSELDAKFICIQAQLNFYNSRDNFLTRCFTIEYTNWFEQLITALYAIDVVVPLGGTSNHFKTAYLRKVGGWDPYTGTEDADIGTRMRRMGYRVAVISSTTYEEANSELINWFRQRSRWITGYMKTYLVAMRQPVKFYKQIGFKSFINFQLFVGGNTFVYLANLPLWIFFIASFFMTHEYLASLYPSIIWHISFFNFIVGNALFLFSNLIGVLRHRLYHLIPFVPLMLLYWLLMSFAGYYAIYEIIVRPGYWYKTNHGMSKFFKH